MSVTFTYDFFISRRGTIAAEAREVADVLNAEGHKVIVQDYDFASSDQFVLDIDMALKQSRHLLILYSRDYDRNFWTQQEFANFQAVRAANHQLRRIGLLRCDDAAPSGLLAGITHGVLMGVTEPAERRRIILAVANGEAPAMRSSPRVFGGSMPLANRLFTGREDLLAAMHAALANDDSAAALAEVAMYGLGGVGKTSLAREYLVRHGADYQGGVWWIAATDRPGTLAGLAALAHALDPRLPGDTPVEAAAHTALDTLAKRQARFLLIYDNAPGPEVLSGLLPPRGANVLITSRHPGWQRQALPLRVEEMVEHEAITLLQRLANRQDEAGARRLARRLGRLPLALDHAGAFVREAQISFDDYAAQADMLIRRAGGNPEYPAGVAATFDLAIVRATEQAPAAEDLLGLFAWFAPENIPLRLVEPTMSGRADALVVLGNLSLIAPATEAGAGPAVTAHRLVQAVMRDRLAAQAAETASRDRALNRMVSIFPYAYNDPAAWPLCRALLPHTRAISAYFPAHHTVPELSRLLSLAASYLQGSGDASGALPLFQKALESRERVPGPDHPNTLTSVNNLALCLQAMGDNPGALPLYRRALETRERVLGVEHPDTLSSVNNLAYCLQSLGDTAGALPLYRRALESRERMLGPEHPGTLSSVNNLAYCLRALGDPAGALPLYRRALESRERVLGPEHPNTLSSVNNLAYCLRALGDAAGALPLYRRALEGSERVLGAEHPGTLSGVNNLAYCLQTVDDAAAAIPLYRRALESRERVLGAEHPDTISSLNNLAYCLRAMGDAAAALPLFGRALDGIAHRLGPDHPTTKTFRYNYEIVAREAGKTGGGR
jgi:tetratricopeptide (TPR) repeat protein